MRATEQAICTPVVRILSKAPNDGVSVRLIAGDGYEAGERVEVSKNEDGSFTVRLCKK